MSELKAFNCVESDLQEFCEPRLVYHKSEVDKQIKELESDKLKLMQRLSVLGGRLFGLSQSHNITISKCGSLERQVAELKSRIHELESMPHTDNSAVIEKLVQENERLVKCCKEYDSRQRIDEQIKFNGAKQLRATKRALWLARATIANSTKYKYHRLRCKAEIDPQPHGWSCYINGEVYRTGKMNRKLEPHYWIELWEEVERKCRAKAEEYK